MRLSLDLVATRLYPFLSGARNRGETSRQEIYDVRLIDAHPTLSPFRLLADLFELCGNFWSQQVLPQVFGDQSRAYLVFFGHPFEP